MLARRVRGLRFGRGPRRRPVGYWARRSRPSSHAARREVASSPVEPRREIPRPAQGSGCVSNRTTWAELRELGDIRIPYKTVLDANAAAAVSAFVQRQRPLWSTEHVSPLRALGTPAYRFADTRAVYLQQVRPENELLRQNLSATYSAVLSALSTLFSERVVLSSEAAHPGFHVLEFCRFPFYEPGPPHTDAPFLRVPWRDPRLVDPSMNFSFVLPVALPRQPCGLEISLPQRYLPSPNAPDCAEARPASVSVPYSIGVLHVFAGSWLHRPSLASGTPQELRITLQGHVVRLNGRLIAYW